MAAFRERRDPLRPSHVERLQSAIAEAEEALLLCPATGEPAAEQLREQACGLVVELQGTLGRLRKRLELSAVDAAGPERAASWMANAGAVGRGVSPPPRLAERRHSAILGRRVYVPA